MANALNQRGALEQHAGSVSQPGGGHVASGAAPSIPSLTNFANWGVAASQTPVLQTAATAKSPITCWRTRGSWRGSSPVRGARFIPLIAGWDTWIDLFWLLFLCFYNKQANGVYWYLLDQQCLLSQLAVKPKMNT